MDIRQKYVTVSLELHLFFARIMKEHALFLEVGFTPVSHSYTEEARQWKEQFEGLLTQAIEFSDGLVSAEVLNSGEVITKFTLNAESQTAALTGAFINQEISQSQLGLSPCDIPRIRQDLFRRTRNLGQTAIRYLNHFIPFHERILQQAASGKLFTNYYPALIGHMAQEAKQYRACLLNFENGRDLDCINMRQSENFWNQIMMEHAMFIRGLSDPYEMPLIDAAGSFTKEYAKLSESSDTPCSLETTLRFQCFQENNAGGILENSVQSVILPLLADHDLREASHYIRLLKG